MRKMFYALLLHFIYRANARTKKMILIGLCLTCLLFISVTGLFVWNGVMYFQGKDISYGPKSFSPDCKTRANDLLEMGLKLRTRHLMKQSKEIWNKCV